MATSNNKTEITTSNNSSNSNSNNEDRDTLIRTDSEIGSVHYNNKRLNHQLILKIIENKRIAF